MPATTLPYLCSGCGHHYGDGPGGVPLLIADGSEVTNLTLEMGGMLMQCPRCGRMNRPALPDGTYNVRGGRWEFVRQITEDLKDAKGSAEDFDTLVRLVREALAKDSPNQAQVAATIAAETPYQRIAAMVRKHPNVLPVLLAVLLWLVPPPYDWGSDKASPPRVTVSQLEHLADHEMDQLARKIAHDVKQDERHQGRHSKPAPTPGSLARLHPQGRNEPCRCGSRVKFKKCCGGPHAKTS